VIVDAAGGKVLSRMELDAGSSHMFGRRVVQAGNVVLFPTDKSIRVLDSANNSRVMEIQVPGTSRMTPVVFRGNAVIVNSIGSVVFLNLETGAPEPFPIQTGATEPVAISITLWGSRGYFADRKNKVVAVDLAGKKVLWERRIDANDYPYQNIVAGNAGIYVYAGTKLFAFGHNGAPLFTVEGVSAAPGFVAGRLVVAKADGSIQLLNEQNGALVWSHNLTSPVSSRPLVSGGQIVVGTQAGEIVFLKPAL